MLNFVLKQRCIGYCNTKIGLSRNMFFLYAQVVSLFTIAMITCFENNTIQHRQKVMGTSRNIDADLFYVLSNFLYLCFHVCQLFLDVMILHS